MPVVVLPLGLVLASLIGGLAPGQDDHPSRIELGRFLFQHPGLSEDGKVSCVTCHDPKRSFADGRVDAVGIVGIPVGRNSPTLFGIGHVATFRDPDQARTARPGARPVVLSLEERCLKPLANELEMGSSIPAAVGRLRQVPELSQRFDKAFGSGGITVERTGRALAAFVRSLGPPPASPYKAYLDGDQSALTAEELRGLSVFETQGCSDCHAGPALSDGLMHVVDPPGGSRILARERLAASRRLELMRRTYEAKDPEILLTMDIRTLMKEAEAQAPKLPGGGGYDASQLEVQTTTLWDVARTGPWFRDGSVTDLGRAVNIHVRELREVKEKDADVKERLRQLSRAGKRSPPSLRPRKPPSVPSVLTAESRQDLLVFLQSLGPR